MTIDRLGIVMERLFLKCRNQYRDELYQESNSVFDVKRI